MQLKDTNREDKSFPKVKAKAKTKAKSIKSNTNTDTQGLVIETKGLIQKIKRHIEEDDCKCCKEALL